MERLVFNIKEHKLEELEKYGFHLVDNWYMYTIHFAVCLSSLWFSYDKDFCLEYKDLVLLYDLIKDGLIIKEKV